MVRWICVKLVSIRLTAFRNLRNVHPSHFEEEVKERQAKAGMVHSKMEVGLQVYNGNPNAETTQVVECVSHFTVM